MLGLSSAILFARLFVLVVAFSVHEFSHAWMAVYLGDETPRLQGRLTLNPLAHLDVMGSLLLLFVGFGWAKPVQINPFVLSRRSPYAMMWVALVGPASNLILAVIGAIPFQLGLVSPLGAEGRFLPTAYQLLSEFVSLNLILMLFNLIPLFPLDGEKIAIHLFPSSIRVYFDRIRPYSSLVLLGLILAPSFLGINILGAILGPPFLFLRNLLVG